MKPIFKYPGGKTRELKNIIKYYPKDTSKTIFVEPFLGGGAVYWNFPEAKEYHVNDISQDLINIYKNSSTKNITFMKTLHSMADDWEKIINKDSRLNFQYCEEKYNWFLNRKMKKMNLNEAIETSLRSAYFVNIRNKFNMEKNSEKRSAFYLFIMTFAFSSLFQYNKDNEINIPYGGKGYNKKSFKNVIDKIVSEEVQNKLSKTKFYSEDFEIFLKRFYNKKNTFVFIDPPYVSDMIYNGAKFTDSKQEKLVTSTKNLDYFLTVIGDNEMIFKIYSNLNFEIKKIPIKFSMNFKGRNETEKFNLYITNKPLIDN